MPPLKLVIDTNVLVSGLLKPDGLERAVLTFALTSPAKLFFSREILSEYETVLRRPKSKIQPAQTKELMALLQKRGALVEPSLKLNVCSDLDDNKFLECAETARIDYLITGNKRHFPKFWKSAKIINARELMEIIAPHLL